MKVVSAVPLTEQGIVGRGKEIWKLYEFCCQNEKLLKFGLASNEATPSSCDMYTVWSKESEDWHYIWFLV